MILCSCDLMRKRSLFRFLYNYVTLFKSNNLPFRMLLKREEIEQREVEYLAPYAFRSSDSKGRDFNEPEDEYRTCFQHDRDRVIHSKAFRRLKGKTQVFVAHYGDHYRSRLTHTMEVAQLSRDLARMLGLNEDLAETIALAPDQTYQEFQHANRHQYHGKDMRSHLRH